MNAVFIENDDSFSWNVIDALPFDRADIRIVSGSDRGGVADAVSSASALVIGPGPMDPVRAGIVEIVTDAARRGLPTLGICLGHQAVGLAFGARLERTEPHHGKRSTFVLKESRLFRAVQGPISAMRYHSLALTEVVSPLVVVAETGQGVIMAVEHRTLPIAGLQFHPDSFGTPRGRELLAAFFEAVT